MDFLISPVAQPYVPFATLEVDDFYISLVVSFSMACPRKTACQREPHNYCRAMPIVLPLKKMSRVEKLRAMEAIWADLSQDETKVRSPQWHELALRQTKHAVEAGEAEFNDWDGAKERVRRKAAKLA